MLLAERQRIAEPNVSVVHVSENPMEEGKESGLPGGTHVLPAASLGFNPLSVVPKSLDITKVARNKKPGHCTETGFHWYLKGPL